MLSSTHGHFQLDDPWVTGEELGLGVFLEIFGGILCLSAAYNDVWHAEAEVQGFLDIFNTVVDYLPPKVP